MTLVATALSLYFRTKAQFHHLTKPTPPAADSYHPSRPIELAFPLHHPRTRTLRRRRRRRLLAAAVRYLLRSFPVAPPLPAPPLVEKPRCRLCAAVIT
ncbi:hypothetical protein [Lentzea flava]|uniref:Uncharacterized protein n=1 Tax=Lentzea flava TaxID=103732 RepID=A0ABQ2VBJ1_9PSEU|nr:hypothetical protein [Lentzea flava]MCP2204222.1 hypothetical protein [Lentzea flava]GGU75537.1 hypothetical protein GCM10010178_78590 [Lentzea flava]